MIGNITALLQRANSKHWFTVDILPSFRKVMFGVCAKRSVVQKIANTGQTNTQWSNEHLHYVTLTLEFSSPVFPQVFKILWIMMIFPLPPPPYPLPPTPNLPLPVPNKPHAFCWHYSPCLLMIFHPIKFGGCERICSLVETVCEQYSFGR